MRFLFLFIFLGFCVFIYPNKIDSLKSELQNKSHNSLEKERALELLMLEYKRVNYDSSLAYCNQTIAILINQKTKESEKRLIQRYLDKGSLLTKLYSIDSAKFYIDTAIELCFANDYNELLGRAYNQLGVLYYKQAKYDYSIDYALKSLKIAEEIGVSKYPPLSLISTSYYAVQNYKKSVEYNIIAENDILSHKRISLKDSLTITTINTNLAGALMNLGDSLIALNRLYKSYEIGTKTNNFKSLSYTTYSLARYYNSNKKGSSYNIDSSFYFLTKSLKYSKLTNDISREVIASVGLGVLLLEQNRNKEAYSELRNILNKVKKNDFKQDVEHLYYFLALAAVSESPDSVEYFLNKRDSIKSSILNAQNIKGVNELTLKYETEKKEYENKILKQDIEVQEKDFKLKSIIGVGVFLVLLMIAIVMFVIVNNRKTKAEKEMIELEQKLLRTQMNPHFIFNSLATIGSFIRANKKEDSYRYITRFGKLMRAILESSREETISLEKEIEIIENFLFLHKLRLGEKLTYEIVLDESIEVDEYDVPPMLLQPFIENAIEHGVEKLNEPSKLIVNIKLENEILILEVEDEGKGFKQVEINNEESYKSYAIQITRERIENMKSRRKVELAINNIVVNDIIKGTKVALAIN